MGETQTPDPLPVMTHCPHSVAYCLDSAETPKRKVDRWLRAMSDDRYSSLMWVLPLVAPASTSACSQNVREIRI